MSKITPEESMTPVRSSPFKVERGQLIKALDNATDRKFCEEVDFLETLESECSLEQALSTSYQAGISSSEIEDRRFFFGSNKREPKKSKNFFQLMLQALEDFTLRILLAASMISITVNTIVEEDERSTAWIEGFAIFVAVMACSLVQAINDYSKEKQFSKLNKMSDGRKTVSVFRDNTVQEVHHSELVVGDVVKIFEGMDIPTDGYIIEANEITTDESAMTGETDPMKKASLKDAIKKRDQIVAEGAANASGAHDVPSPIILSGTKVLTGEGRFLVIVVGDSSSVGKIQALLSQDSEVTPLQGKLEKIATDIGKFGMVSSIITFLVLLIRFLADRGRNGDWSDKEKYVELVHYFILAVTVVVLAIPEGLPLAVTLSLAYSVKKMLKDQNLVRRIQACETMGGADMICSDKTGTLTQNKMTLNCFWNEKLINIDTYTNNQDLLNYVPKTACERFKQALSCNSSATLRPLTGSKTEIALLEFMERVSVDFEKVQEMFIPKGAIKFPFSSQRKRMSTVIIDSTSSTGRTMLLKGASEFILASCTKFYSFEMDTVSSMTSDLKQQTEQAIKNMADSALRTIGIAFKEVSENDDFTTKDEKNVFEIEKRDFTLIAILGIKDILRPEVPGAVAKCRRAGIKVRMVTGDNVDTATAIAKECGIITPGDTKSLVLEGSKFQEIIGGVVCKKCRTKECDCPRDKATALKKKLTVREDVIQNKEAFIEVYKHLDVMARSRPEDKYALVTGLKECKHVVAVTGDGTNDAPALKKADVGFAMGIAGTEVAREAAAIILLDDNFNSIIKAAMWGRNIYDSIKKFLQFQLTVNIVSVFITLIGSGVIKQSILSAVQMLWVNLIMDTFASLALATERPSEKLLERPPHHRDEYILTKKMMKFILGHATYQLLIVIIITFLGPHFILEFRNDICEIVDGKIVSVIYSDSVNCGGGHYVRSGNEYLPNGDEDYAAFETKYGPSRHHTFTFNTFVIMQIFNFVNARKLEDELNIFEGMARSQGFVIIVIFITIMQIILGTFGGLPLGVYNHDGSYGMHIANWGIALCFGLGEWVVGFLLKFIPDKNFCTAGKATIDPIKKPSAIMSFKRSGTQNSFVRRLNGGLGHSISTLR